MPEMNARLSRYPVRCCGLALFSGFVALLAAPCSASFIVRPRGEPVAYSLRAHDLLANTPGPEGVIWCSANAKPMSTVSSDYEVARRIAVAAGPGDPPLLEFTLPRLESDISLLGLGPDGSAHFALGVMGLDPSAKLIHAIRVYSFVSPTEFAVLQTDPSPCLRVSAEDITDPERILRYLQTGRLKYVLLGRCYRQISAIKDSLRAQEQMQNEPWRQDPQADEKLLESVADLINTAIGGEAMAASLYTRSAFSQPIPDTFDPFAIQSFPLPVQIVSQMKRVWDLGVDPNSEATPELAREAVAAQQPTEGGDDPWANFRTKPDGTQDPQQPADEHASERQDPEVNRQIRFLNRMLLEYELGGLLHGTMYKWVKDVNDGTSCDGGPEKDYRAGGSVWDDSTVRVMPMRFSPQMDVELLLDSGGRPGDAVDRRPYFGIGPGGELFQPKDMAGLGRFYVRGTGIHWVKVQQEGQPANWGLR